jgi:hypothetical protein
LLVTAGNARCAAADQLFTDDKAAHLATSYGTLSTALILRKVDLPRWEAVAIACGITLALGTIKGLFTDDPYSWLDQRANLLGTAGGAAFVFIFRF